MRVLLLNGPNLNLLGTRRPDVYGSTTLSDLTTIFRGWAATLGIAQVEDYQSNHEGHLIDRLHGARGTIDGIVFNPGAFTHTSYALHDAIEAVEVSTVETHISNVEEREDWRRQSVVRPACLHTIYGRGVEGYRWALRHLVNTAAWPVVQLAYGEGPEQFADLRVPAGEGPFPVVVLVHGGFWRHQWTRDSIESVAVDLVRRGIASLNVEYRRVGEAGGNGGGRASVDDVAAAITTGLADPRIDSQRWAVAGHSAGGHLAYAALSQVMVDHPVPQLAVSLAGVVDLEGALRDDLGGGAAAAYVGGGDVVALSPSRMLPLGAPSLLAHGRRDDRVPFSQSADFVAAARAAGDDVQLLEHDGGHFEFLEPEEPAWQAVLAALVEALD